MRRWACCRSGVQENGVPKRRNATVYFSMLRTRHISPTAKNSTTRFIFAFFQPNPRSNYCRSPNRIWSWKLSQMRIGYFSKSRVGKFSQRDTTGTSQIIRARIRLKKESSVTVFRCWVYVICCYHCTAHCYISMF